MDYILYIVYVKDREGSPWEGSELSVLSLGISVAA